MNKSTASVFLLSLAAFAFGCEASGELSASTSEACDCPETAAAQEIVLPVYVVPVTAVIHGRAGVPAMCDAGDLALSGGCMGRREDGPAVLFQGALLLDDVGAPAGWFCEAVPEGPGDWTVYASASCLTIGQE